MTTEPSSIAPKSRIEITLLDGTLWMGTFVEYSQTMNVVRIQETTGQMHDIPNEKIARIRIK